MAKTIEPFPSIFIGNFILFVVIAYVGIVLKLIFVDKKPFEKAVVFFLEQSKPLQKQDTEIPIDETLICSIRDQPAYDFEGNEFQDVRNVNCADCHNYVYKQGEQCFPYKHNSDEGYCEVNTAISGLCPFDIQ
jgi:hypothetical protein